MTTLTQEGKFILSGVEDGYRYLGTLDHARFAQIVVAMEGESPRPDLEARASLLASAPQLRADLQEAERLLRDVVDGEEGDYPITRIRAFLTRRAE